MALSGAAAARAQCPVPPLAPPAVDGFLDPIYFSRGFSTDYVADNADATATLHQIDDVCVDSQFIYLAWEIDLAFVDNSYGSNRNMGSNYPWPGGHSFFDLAESDGQRLQILNVCGQDVVDLFMDYIDGPIGGGSSYSTPSGYGTDVFATETMRFLINGGDWSRFTYVTSLAGNLNDLGFCESEACAGSGPPGTPIGDGTTDLLVDSPPWADEDNYVPASPYDPWEYRHIYEIRIDRSVFSTAACPQGTPALIRTDPVELHASPSKTGESPVDLFRAYSSIGDYVWLDADRDGVQDPGEPGLANVTLDLYRDGDGDGVFEPDTPVIDGELDMNRDGVVGAADDGTLAGVTVIDGLLDLDGDGTAGEAGDDSGTLNGVRVLAGRLDVDDDMDVDGADDGIFAGDDGGPALSTVTDSSGGYLFRQLGAGSYFVDVTDDNGTLAGFSLVVGPQSETDPSALVDLPLQEENLEVDFGYAPTDLTTAVVGDFVWSDADNDGIQDPGEAGIGGVTVDLIDLDTMTVVATATTAADGSYLFTGVAAGDYTVDVTDTAGVLAGYTLTVGPQSETDPATGFHVDPGSVYLNADFGYFNPALGAIGNFVWLDLDEDAVVDAGEPGLGSVTVALIDDLDGDGIWDSGEPIIATRPTAADGSYVFPGLALDDGGGDGDADYLVWVSDTKNVLGPLLESIFLPLGSTADNISKIPAYAVDIAAAAAVDNTADFGYILDNPAGLVGDRVWYDGDGDGLQESGEPGIEGVRIVAYTDRNQNGIIDGSGGNQDRPFATRTTDINGNYYFQRLDFDNNGEGYILVVSQLNGFDVFDGVLDLDGDGVAGETNGDDDGAVDGVAVDDGLFDLDGDGTAGETNGDDSGFFAGYRVTDGKLDLDGDGTGGETNGDDSRFAPLKNFFQTGDPDEAGTCTTCDGRGATVLSTATTIDLSLDFGYDGVGTFQIGDTVYNDLDGDGTQDPGEPGIELVTLALYQDLDGDGVVDVDEPLIAEKVTDAAGNYLFDDVTAGDYVVVITDDNGILIGYTQTQGSPFEPVASGELSTLDKDFGFVRDLPASISNFVWEDLDGDGIQDAGEPGVRNVQVRLWAPGADGMSGGGDDVLVAATFTDAAGLYRFDVPPGRYFVEIVAPAGFLVTANDRGGDDTIDSDPDPATGRAPVTLLIIGENDPTWDGGLFRPVAVGDRVWLDIDGDGIQDIGEPGIANVTVELFDPGADGSPGGGDDVSLGTAVTDLEGEYLFAGKAPATYFVAVETATLPGGLVLSGGTDPSSDSTLLSGQVVLDKDFGYTDDGAGVIGDFVWSDADADGVQDPGEPGIGGVTLDLVAPGADGLLGTADDLVVDTETTAADGSYYFTGVPIGDYWVVVTDSGGVLAGYTLTSGPQSSTVPTAPIAITAGEVFVNADFGYFQAGLGTIGTHVWLDADDSGTRDAGEEGIANVSLALVLDANGDGVWDPDGPDDVLGNSDDEKVIATTRTAADGGYLFSGLALDDGDGDADYLVVVTDVDSELAGLAKTGAATPGADDNSQVVPYAVALAAGSADDPTADFGYNKPGAIGDRIWNDADGDGLQDPGEAGIGGVTVDLLGPGPDLTIGTADDVVLETTTTAADGSYLFSLLRPGDYRVVVTDTSGVLAGYSQSGDPDEAGTCSTCDGESTTTLVTGESDLTRDFGYRNGALFDISGTVFVDLDEDGFEDAGEVGIPGVTLALLDSAGNVIATTTTDAAGDYVFPDLPDGDYTVTVTDLDGVLDGYRLTSGLDAIAVTLAGADVTDVDFGYIRDPRLGSIGDFVWFDADRDGFQDASEPGIAGVTLDVIDVGEDGLAGTADDVGVVASVTTDANGGYVFSGLAAGNYVVDVTDAAGALAGLAPTAGTTDPSGVINLSQGEDYEEADFGYASAVLQSLGDTIWHDADNDGFEDPGEVGIAGVSVSLIDPGPDNALGTADDVGVIATATTDARGGYLFTGLADGKYYVEVDTTTLPAGYLTTPTNGPALRPFNVPPGEDVLYADFGFRGAATGTIGNQIWLDKDGDGLFEPLGNDAMAGTPDDEPGLDAVTVDLIRDFNGDGAWDPDGADNLPGTADDEPVVATVASDNVGFYRFVGLSLSDGGDGNAGDADYLIAVTDLAGVLTDLNLTAGTAGADDNSQSDPYAVRLTSAAPDDPTADFGYTASGGVGSIGNLVFHDVNNNGVFEPAGTDGIVGTADDESGIEGVTVQLWLDDGDGNYEPFSGDDNLLRTVVTDANGEYFLEGLPLASYWVDVTDTGPDGAPGSGDEVLAGFVKTSGAARVDDNSQDEPYPVTLTAASPSDPTADFGYYATADLAISGTVFFDVQGDGTLDPPAGDVGVSVAVLFLFRDLNGDGVVDSSDPLFRSVTVSDGTIDVNGDGLVDPIGFYQFSNLPPGDYIVTADPSASFVDGLPQTTQLVPGVPQAGVQPVTLVASDSTDNDFGFTIRSTAVLVSGFEALPEGGGLRLRWETASQSGTVGFYLYRRAGSGWVQVNERLLPAPLDAPQGAVYELVDATAPAGAAPVYSLVEVEAAGGERVYGPFAPRLGTRPAIGLGKSAPGSPAAAARAVPRPRGARMERRLEAMRASAPSVGATSAPKLSAQRPGRRPARSDLRLKIEVEVDGLYFVGAGEIASLLELPEGAVSAALRAGEVALSSGGEAVAWEARANGLVFFGTAVDSPYTRSNVYWLELGRGVEMASTPAGAAAGGATSYAATERFERDVFSVTVVADSPVEDFYYWAFVIAGDESSGTASVGLEVADPVVSGGARLRLELQGVTSTPASVDHRAVVRLNGVEIGETWWDGASPHAAQLAVPAGVLVAGGNTLEIEGLLPGGVPYSTFLLDSLELEYERRLAAVEDRLLFTSSSSGAVAVAGFSGPGVAVYDVTRPAAPVRLTAAAEWPGEGWTVGFTATAGGRYLAVAGGPSAPSSVRSRPRPRLGELGGGVEYVAIAPAGLEAAAEELVAYRAGFGLSGAVVELETLYDVFAEGLSTPEAVRAFLGWAWSRWSTKPRYAVLAGAGSFDYLDVQGIGGNLVPPLMVATPYGLFASDAALGDVVGSDGVPEIAVGRIPALSAAELSAYVAKLAAYESAGGASRALFIVDDGDDAGDFPAASAALAGRLPSGVEATTADLSAYSASEARQRIFAAVAAGADRVNYLGHGGLNRLADEGLLLAADAELLVGPRLPVLAALTCSVGRFEVPGFESLAEALVMAPDGGAAAVFAPTGQSLNFEAVRMNEAWIDALYAAENRTVGDAVLATLAYEQAGPFPFMRSIFNLLGDPAFGIR